MRWLQLTIVYDDTLHSVDEAVAIAAKVRAERGRRVAAASLCGRNAAEDAGKASASPLADVLRAWLVTVRLLHFSEFREVLRSEAAALGGAGSHRNLRFVVSGALATTDEETQWVEALIASGVALQWSERGTGGRFVGPQYAVRSRRTQSSAGLPELEWVSTLLWPALVSSGGLPPSQALPVATAKFAGKPLPPQLTLRGNDTFETVSDSDIALDLTIGAAPISQSLRAVLAATAQPGEAVVPNVAVYDGSWSGGGQQQRQAISAPAYDSEWAAPAPEDSDQHAPPSY